MSRFFAKLRALFRKESLDAEMGEEMRLQVLAIPSGHSPIFATHRRNRLSLFNRK